MILSSELQTFNFDAGSNLSRWISHSIETEFMVHVPNIALCTIIIDLINLESIGNDVSRKRVDSR